MAVSTTEIVYYMRDETNKLYNTNSRECINPDGNLWSIGNQQDYIVATFDPFLDTNPYKIMVFDKDGNIVFKSADYAKSINIYKDVLSYIDNTDFSYNKVKLK